MLNLWHEFIKFNRDNFCICKKQDSKKHTHNSKTSKYVNFWYIDELPQ